MTPSWLRRSRLGVLLALLVGAAVVLAGCSGGGDGSSPTVTVTRTATPSDPPTTPAPTTSTPTPSTSSPTPTKTKPTGPPVHIKLFNVDGSTYGVGMPVIVFFNREIKNAKAFQDATTLSINGKRRKGAWYFEPSGYLRGYPYEAHFRMKDYWPAHSHIRVNMPVKGLQAGKYVFDDSLSLTFNTGPKNIGVVDNNSHKLTITSDGKKYGTFPVSLGASKPSSMRTLRGTKVIMEKGLDISMKGPGYYDPHVKYTQRLTYGGEYLHSAPWNCTSGWHCEGPQNNIGHANSSNGCTNLRPADAKRLYGFLRIGDVVKFPNADGPLMQIGQGYGGWNIHWAQWQTGGAVSTR